MLNKKNDKNADAFCIERREKTNIYCVPTIPGVFLCVFHFIFKTLQENLFSPCRKMKHKEGW